MDGTLTCLLDTIEQSHNDLKTAQHKAVASIAQHIYEYDDRGPLSNWTRAERILASMLLNPYILSVWTYERHIMGVGPN